MKRSKLQKNLVGIELLQSNFLDFMYQKGEAYSNIDTARFPIFWSKYSHLFVLPKTIQLIGTNGKGSTGRTLANFLHNRGCKTLHYTSPHILEINERFWIDGANISSDQLHITHLELLSLISQKDLENLSYFEYATLIAIKLATKVDYFVCEAGLGGEFDATSVLPVDLMLVTPIGLDHQKFLGNTIEEIATTKLRAIRSDVIIADQKHEIVYEIASKLSKGFEIYKSSDITDIEFASSDATYMATNRKLAFAGANYLALDPKPDEFFSPAMFGRLTQIETNIFVDVGHNELAASEIARSFEGKKVVLIYNSFEDKDYRAILEVLKPITKSVIIAPLNSPRAVDQRLLTKQLNDLEIKWSNDLTISDDETYLVFGSFGVVEAFLKQRL